MFTLSYLDAATGSMIASVVVGGFAGVVLMVKRYWFQFTALFSKSRREQLEAMKHAVAADAEQDDEEEPEELSESLTFDG